ATRTASAVGVLGITQPRVSGTLSFTMARDLRPQSIRRNNAVTSSIRPAVVVGANRIPFARAGGRYAASSNKDMLAAALEGLVARFGLAGERLDEVSAGAVLKHSRDFNLTQESVLGSSLAPSTTAYDVQSACGPGLYTYLGISTLYGQSTTVSHD